MYQSPKTSLWQGRSDPEEKALGKRWHEQIQQLPSPYQQAGGVALLGFDCDEGVKRNQGRVGAANASDVLKKALANFAYHTKNTALYDAGKIIASTDLEHSQATLAEHINTLLSHKHFPIILGGGHETAYGSFSGLFNYYQQQESIAIINFDAHFDLRKSSQATSGTPFYQIASLCQQHNLAFDYLCLGISQAANTQALFNRANELGVHYLLDTQMNYGCLDVIKQKIDDFLHAKQHLYLTIDADVLTPYSMPAVSSPAARGIEPALVYDLLAHIINTHQGKIKLFDLTEYNPTYDIQEIGAKVAARLIYDVVQLLDNTRA